MTWKNRESIFVFRNVVNLYIFKGTYNAQTMLSICIDRSKIRLGGGYWTRRERRAVASFVYGSCPFSQASRRLRAPLYDPAPAQRRRRDPVRPSYPSPRFDPHLPCSLVVQVTWRWVSFAVAAAIDRSHAAPVLPAVRWLGMDASLSFLARVLVLLLLSMCCSTATHTACRPAPLSLCSALCFTDRGRWTVEASRGCLVILVCLWFSENHSKINIQNK